LKTEIPVPRPEVVGLKEYVPGKPIEEVCRQHRLKSAIKLASNENPIGPSPRALESISRAFTAAHRYPQGNAPELSERLARFYNISSKQLIFSNGSDEMIQMVMLAWLSPGQEMLCCEPTFSEYRFAAELAGGVVRTIPLKEGSYDVEGLIEAIDQKTKVIVICNPNNPTGGWVGRREIGLFLEQVPPEILVVVDQAYAEFAAAAGVEEYPDLIEELHRPNLLLLRTFSKLYGLAGLRIGYAMGHPSLIQTLYKVKQPFNLGSLSQVAAIAAIDDTAHQKKTLDVVRTGLDALFAAFNRWGWTALPTAANFIAVRPNQGSAEQFVQDLEKRGVILRWLKSFGMEEWFRISVGTSEENALFITEAERWRQAFTK